MKVKELLSRYIRQNGLMHITDGEESHFIGAINVDAVRGDYIPNPEEAEALLNRYVVRIENNTTAISGSKKVDIVLEITIDNWQVTGDYDI